MAMTMMTVAIQGKRETRSRSWGAGQVSPQLLQLAACISLCLVINAHRRQTQLTNLVSTPRQVDIVWNKQDLAMILYHAISISLLPSSKWKEKPFSNYDHNRQTLSYWPAQRVHSCWQSLDVINIPLEINFQLFCSIILFSSWNGCMDSATWTYDFAVQWDPD